MKHYSRYGFNEFVLALGHKGDQIKRYFLDYHAVGQDMTISLQDGQVAPLNNRIEPWTVHLVETGEATLTGGRLRQLQPLIGAGTFMLTYGDGVGNIPIDELLAFHRSRGALATLTAVRPPARFGAPEFDGDRFRHFKEKSTLHEGWINGGVFVLLAAGLTYIESGVMWEHAPKEALAAPGQLVAYPPEQFQQIQETLPGPRHPQSLLGGG